MKRVSLEFRDVTLSAGRGAIRDFLLTAYEGEYIAIMGADGSGKGVLAQALLSGAVCQSGEILLGGERYAPMSIQEAHARKVFLISKGGDLIGTQSVAENIFHNHAGSHAFRIANDRLIESEANAILREFGLDIDARTPAGNFSQALQCILEIVKWHAHGARVLVLNNALAVATAAEYRLFLRVIDQARAAGTAILHLMNRCIDIFSAADRCVLLSPKGRAARTIYREDFCMETINEYIGRRESRMSAPAAHAQPGPEILRAENVLAGRCRGVSFSLCRGEALGLFCKDGEELDAVAYALCGACRYSGTFFLNGAPVRISCPADARKLGIGLLLSDPRRLYYPDLTPEENVAMPFMRRVGNRFGVLKEGKIRALRQDADRCLDNLKRAFKQADGEEYMPSVLSRFLLYPYRILVLPHPSAINDVCKEDMVCHLIDVALERGCALIIASTRRAELEVLCSKILTLEKA